MTFDEFHAICAKEIPCIGIMQRAVQNIGADYVSCTITKDGHINFDAHYEKESFCAYHSTNIADDEYHATHYDTSGKPWKTIEQAYGKYINSMESNDGVEDDIPVQ